MSEHGEKIAHIGQSVYHGLHVVANFNSFFSGDKYFLNARQKLLHFPFVQPEVERAVLTQPISRHLK